MKFRFGKLYLLVFLLCYSIGASAQGILCPPNLDFDYGNFINWKLYSGSVTTNIWSPPGYVTPGGHTITAGVGIDPHGGFPVVAPGGGSFSVKLGHDVHGDFQERVRYYIHIPANIVNYSFIYKMAVVLEDPGHQPALQPKMRMIAYDSASGHPIPCAERLYVAASNLPGFSNSQLDSNVHYLPWSIGTIDLSGYPGSTIILDIETYACFAGYHFAYGYFDVISCGPYEASLLSCNLDSCGLTLSAPPGFQSYQWYRSNWTSAGNGQTLNCVPPQNPPGPFYVVMTPYGGMGCDDTLETNVISDITLQVTDSLCFPHGVPFTVNPTIGGGVPPLNIEWTGSGLSCDHCPNPSIINPGGNIYTIKVSDSNNCFRTDTLRFFEGYFSVEAGDSLTICVGTPVQLNAVVTPSWGNYTYTWTPGVGLSNTGILQPLFTPGTNTLGTTTYVLEVDSGYCTKKDSIVITTLPNEFGVHDTAICKGVIFQMPATGNMAFNYSWAPVQGLSNPNIADPVVSVDTTTTFTLVANNPHCPTLIATVTVEVEPVPDVRLGPDAEKCQWDALPVDVKVTPAWYSKYTYTWIAHPDLYENNSGQMIFTGPADTTLWLTVSTPAGCSGSDSMNVKVHPGNFASITPIDTFICPGESVTIQVAGGVSYQWTPDNYLSGTSDSEKLSTPAKDILYTVLATDEYGCTDTVYSSINLYSDAFTSLPDTVFLFPGEVYEMNPGGNALYYRWWPPIGLSAPPGINPTTIANPIAAPETDYRYYVEAVTEAGCKVIDSIYIAVVPDSYLDIPNAFSPGSPPNEVFKLIRKGEAILRYFRIYNRWGNKVFETKDIDEGWDGRYNGVPQPVGVYVFVVEAITKSGKLFQRAGNVTLIR